MSFLGLWDIHNLIYEIKATINAIKHSSSIVMLLDIHVISYNWQLIICLIIWMQSSLYALSDLCFHRQAFSFYTDDLNLFKFIV